jgi:hypothetical protein
MNDSERQQLDRLLDNDLPLGERDAVQQRFVADAEAVTYFAKRAILVSDLRRSLKRRRLQHDTMYTTGHTRTWHALPDASFPQELLVRLSHFI